jgi:cephalosporin-C deacetylase-like acetyl esterase
MQSFSSHVDGYYDVADQMAHFLRRAAEQALAQQLSEKAALTSVAEFEARRARVQAAFLAAIGGLPERTGPLNARCTGTLDRGPYRIEKIIYESLPEFYVTAALYLPTQVAAPAPAVIFVHGHSDLGKSYPQYQAVCIDLVRNGFFVLAVDPSGQGERKQSYDPATGTLRIANCTAEHTYHGLQFMLGGASLARQFIWDVVRGVDYLESRPEVDPQRIGITGNSGGGTQTTLLMMAEPRLAAAVPCTFIMTLESYMKSGQPQDSEQIVAGCFVDGPDHDDYLTVLAPKPVLVGAAAYDFFPLEGAQESVARAKAVYRLYGAEEKVALAVAPTGHEYSAQLREAAVNWFRVHLQGAAPDFRTGPVETLPEDALWCTPKGQVLDCYPQSRTLADLSRAWLAQHAFRRSPLQGESQRTAHVQQMRRAIVETLGVDLAQRAAPVVPRIIWQGEARGYATEKIFFFSEADVVVTGVMIHPHGEAVQTDLVLFENGTDEMANQAERLHDLLAAQHRLFVLDVRGTGAVHTRPVTPHGHPHDTEYKLGCDALMLKRSTLGMRVLDVLRGYDYLRTRADGMPVGLIGVDSGAFYGYFAAALEEGLAPLVFENLLASYHELASSLLYDDHRYTLKVMAWGLLRRFDLIDLLPCLASRPCTFVGLRNAQGEAAAGEAWLESAAHHGYLPSGWRPQVQG